MTIILLFADECLVMNCVSLHGQEYFSKIDDISDNLNIEWTVSSKHMLSFEVDNCQQWWIELNWAQGHLRGAMKEPQQEPKRN